MTLGDIIREYREANKVPMGFVADKCGISKGYVNTLEKNLTSKSGEVIKPTLETVVKISKGLKIELWEILAKLDDTRDMLPRSEDDIELTFEEKKLIEKYRALDEHGRKVTRMILLCESERCDSSDG